MRNSLYYLLFLLFFSCSEEWEEALNFHGQLTGYIYYPQGGPLEGASVRLTSPQFNEEVKTNAFGRYSIKSILRGDYTIHISKENFLGTSGILTIGGGIVNQQDYTLEKGQSLLSVSETAINATVVKGEYTVQIISNSHWTVHTEADWISLWEQEGEGNAEVKISWDENLSPEERYADIVFSAGEVTSAIRVHQSFPSKLLHVDGKVGDLVTMEKTKVDLLFNGPVTIKSITTLNWYCSGEPFAPSYHSENHAVSFTYSCGRLAGKYPFTLEWEDLYGNIYRDNFEVDFFDETLEISGMVTGRFFVPNEDKLWVLTSKPSKIYQIDLKSLQVLKDFPLEEVSVFPQYITLNPYNQLLYISDDAHLDIYNPQTGKKVSRVNLPPVDYQPSMFHYVVDMAFNDSGMGILKVYQSGSSGTGWFVMDTSDKNRIYSHERNGWNEGQYHEVSHVNASFNQKNVMMFGAGIDARGLIQTDENIETFTTLHSFFDRGIMPSGIHYSRTDERVVVKHHGMDILEGDQLFEVEYLGFRPYVVDFAFPKDQLYAVDADTHTLHVVDYKNNNIVKSFNTGGGQWTNVAATIDGEYLLIETNDHGYNPEDESFTSKFFLFTARDFY